MFSNPISEITGFTLSIGGYVIGTNSPWRKFPSFFRALVATALAALLVIAVISWMNLVEFYWYENSIVLIRDAFDLGHPVSMWCLAVLSFMVSAMTFYWEEDGRHDVHWPVRWVVFRATTTLITSSILTNVL